MAAGNVCPPTGTALSPGPPEGVPISPQFCGLVSRLCSQPDAKPICLGDLFKPRQLLSPLTQTLLGPLRPCLPPSPCACPCHC